MPTEKPKSTRELLVMVLIAIIGFLGSIAAAYITSNRAAGPAAQRELDQRATSVEILKDDVTRLNGEISALKAKLDQVRLLGRPDSSKKLDREYVAESDGLVNAWVTVDERKQVVVLYGNVAEVVGGEVITTSRSVAHIYTDGPETRSAALSFPVRKGERWTIRVSAQNNDIHIRGSQVLWIPWQ